MPHLQLKALVYAGLRSECLKQARAEVSDHLTAYLSKNNLSKEEGGCLCQNQHNGSDQAVSQMARADSWCSERDGGSHL